MAVERARVRAQQVIMTGSATEGRCPGLDPIPDGLHVAPGHDRVDEPVAATPGEVVVGEAEPQQISPVVVEKAALKWENPA